MQGHQFMAALQALPDGGHSSVVVERDGWFYTVESVELTGEKFVLLRLAAVPDGPSDGSGWSSIPTDDLLPGDVVLWWGARETIERRDVDYEALRVGGNTAWRTQEGAILSWPVGSWAAVLMPRPEPS